MSSVEDLPSSKKSASTQRLFVALLAICLGLLATEFLVIYVTFQKAGHYHMVYGQVLFFWLYQVVPVLASAISVFSIWLTMQTKKARWLFMPVVSWAPSALLLLGSSFVSH
jgi:hypothetical protein